jgi:hypothetical protein
MIFLGLGDGEYADSNETKHSPPASSYGTTWTSHIFCLPTAEQ